ncbi:inactive phospholipase C-like protein 1 isoform X2 [Hemiscyllium ocellatum]|uniref:inactive phospholipase C-like protein 1 isoform X2 n=1 Tax=Hemiscyllium ocellatum TaxID=170820 RepID=UPI00296609E3|nr:inactive phospholipase C-like protein 1 isoform X2 [Hemiscyllium ocellatum]
MHKMAEGRKESGLDGSELLEEPEPVGDSRKAWDTTEEDLETVGAAVASGKGRRRRSAVSAAGDRFSPGESTSLGTTGDVEACLIEAAKATPRRSSIIKDSTKQKHEQKKTVSFSSMPSERKINNASDCISFMQAGCELKKIRSNTRIYSRFFTLDPDLQALRWEPSKKDPEKAKLEISSLKEVRVGKNTEIFRSCAVVDQICEDCSFSLIYGENYESLDLVASSADIANIWVTGLRYVISHNKQTLNLIDGSQNTLRTTWLHSVFSENSKASNGIMLEDEAVKLIMQLNHGLKESKIRIKIRELQSNKGKLATWVTKEEFTDIYYDLCTRPEVYFLLVQISRNKEFLDAKDLMFFLETEQGMINATEEMCLDLIRRYEPSKQGQLNGNLSIDGFTRYLISQECNIFDPEHKKVCQDMTQPLSHYYINASYNTYVTENTARSPSDLLGYIRALKLGCRSIELDVYDGPHEPVVSKRNNVTSPVSFNNVIKVINQYAFVTSEYPLIICLRNHCSVGQQKVMAQKLKMILGNKIFTEPPNSTQRYLPSPEKLKRKIILKGKKLPQNIDLAEGDVTDEDEETESSQSLTDTFFVTKRIIHLCRELSDLVTLCKTVQFNSFHNSMKRQKYWEMCDFGEDDDYIGDEFIGQYTIPYECLQSGYRHIPLHSFTGEEIELATLFVHIAITDRRGGGKAHKRGYSVRKGKNTIKYTMLRNTGIKVVDDAFKIAGQPLREAADIRENMQNAIISFKEVCALAPTANLTQCILTMSSRLLNNVNTSTVTLNMKDKYPYLEPIGTLSDVQKKILSSYDLVIHEARYLIDVADTIYDKIMQCWKSGLEFHRGIHGLAKKEGLKGAKINKALENFAWNITVLKGQGDLLKNAKNEALENMKQIQTACVSCGLSKSTSGSASIKSK